MEAEKTRYDELVMRYTHPKLSDIFKEGDLYRVQTSAEKDLAARYGFQWSRCALRDAETKSCTRCGRALTTIRADERWVMDESSLCWCGDCQAHRPVAVMQHFPEQEMPRLMRHVIQQINDHPCVLQLNRDTRQMVKWLAEDQRRRSEDNKWLRDVWSFLYLGR